MTQIFGTRCGTQRVRDALVLCAIGVALATVAEAQPGVPETRVVIPRRFVADSFWVRTWIRGASKEPDLFTEPRQIVAVGDIVAVLDAGMREVFVLEASTGALRVQLSSRGEGPGEFKRPAQLTAANGGFALLDHATSRLSVFDARGRFSWDTPIGSAVGTEGLCVQPDGRVTTKRSGSKDALLTIDSTGRTVATRSLPWPDPGQKSTAVAALVAGPDARGACIIARRYGSEWLLVPRAGAFVRLPYVSKHPEATITVKNGPKRRVGNEGSFVRTELLSSDAAVSAAMLRGDTLILRGGPAERDGYRLLDYYLLPSGRYIHSRRLPAIFIATAVGSDGTFYATSIGEESGAVMALRPVLTKPGAKPSAVRQPGSSPVSR